MRCARWNKCLVMCAAAATCFFEGMSACRIARISLLRERICWVWSACLRFVVFRGVLAFCNCCCCWWFSEKFYVYATAEQISIYFSSRIREKILSLFIVAEMQITSRENYRRYREQEKKVAIEYIEGFGVRVIHMQSRYLGVVFLSVPRQSL